MIAEAVAELGLELGAEAIVHGCTGKGNDQVRIELAVKATYPGVKVIAPLRDKIWTREEEIEYALARGIPVSATRTSPYSVDENMFGRSIEAGRDRGRLGAAARRRVGAHRRRRRRSRSRRRS